MYPANFSYSKEHEWVQLDGDVATVGITDHAQKQLGDIVFVELPKVGDKVEAARAADTEPASEQAGRPKQLPTPTTARRVSWRTSTHATPTIPEPSRPRRATRPRSLTDDTGPRARNSTEADIYQLKLSR